jgi:4-amino-4-deoxy-L-arabinose transferase-like glycosyltransferase
VRGRAWPPAGWIVPALAVAFALRGIFLDLALPYGDPLDEPFHLAYASFPAETGRVPTAREPSVALDVLRPLNRLPRSAAFGPPWFAWGDFVRRTPSDRTLLRTEAYRFEASERRSFVTPNYETQQPPLVYLLSAVFLRFLPRTTVDHRLLDLRLLATVCAAFAIPLWYRFFRRLLPKRSALAATAVCVVLPGAGSLVGRFTNDALALPIAAALLILLVDLSRGRLDQRRALLLAGTLAAGCWTKLYFLPLLGTPVVVGLCAPAGRRGTTLRRAAAASALALLLFLPWMAHQHHETGDWLGLTPSKMAAAAGVGIGARLAALSGAFRPRYWIVFGRTFLWPGTDSAMGAPAAAAAVLSAGLLALWLAPLFSSRSPSRRLSRGAVAAAVAVVVFVGSELLYNATFAAVARAYGRSTIPQGFGWYAAILTPAVLAMGCLSGRPTPRWVWPALTGCALLVGWWLDLGVLPGVYSGRTSFNASNVPLAAYLHLSLSPTAAMRIYDAVGLIEPGAALLGVVWVSWQLALLAALGRSLLRSVRR